MPNTPAKPAKPALPNVQIHRVKTFAEAAKAAVEYAQKTGAKDFGIVPTDSMDPHFPAGRTIRVSEPGDPGIGDVVTFKNGNKLFIHQVTKKGLGRYSTKGTNTQGEDAGYRTKKDIVGVVRHVWVSDEPQQQEASK